MTKLSKLRKAEPLVDGSRSASSRNRCCFGMAMSRRRYTSPTTVTKTGVDDSNMRMIVVRSGIKSDRLAHSYAPFTKAVGGSPNAAAEQNLQRGVRFMPRQ